MARRRYTRRYRRRSSRWSPNIANLLASVAAPADQSFFGTIELATNPVQSNQTVSQTYTVKNVELTFQLELGTGGYSYIENLAGYIMYVPQGMQITVDYPQQHPEYIMAYRFFGSPEYESAATAGIRQPLRVRSRLARKLQTGDSIIFMVVGVNITNSNSFNVDIHGLVRWWTKAN